MEKVNYKECDELLSDGDGNGNESDYEAVFSKDNEINDDDDDSMLTPKPSTTNHSQRRLGQRLRIKVHGIVHSHRKSSESTGHDRTHPASAIEMPDVPQCSVVVPQYP